MTKHGPNRNGPAAGVICAGSSSDSVRGRKKRVVKVTTSDATAPSHPGDSRRIDKYMRHATTAYAVDWKNQNDCHAFPGSSDGSRMLRNPYCDGVSQRSVPPCRSCSIGPTKNPQW